MHPRNECKYAYAYRCIESRTHLSIPTYLCLVLKSIQLCIDRMSIGFFPGFQTHMLHKIYTKCKYIANYILIQNDSIDWSTYCQNINVPV